MNLLNQIFLFETSNAGNMMDCVSCNNDSNNIFLKIMEQDFFSTCGSLKRKELERVIYFNESDSKREQ